ncbi:unnamed protein product [Calypogeia fissa]
MAVQLISLGYSSNVVSGRVLLTRQFSTFRAQPLVAIQENIVFKFDYHKSKKRRLIAGRELEFEKRLAEGLKGKK